jgi:hypothetical protein
VRNVSCCNICATLELSAASVQACEVLLKCNLCERNAEATMEALRCVRAQQQANALKMHTCTRQHASGVSDTSNVGVCA